MEKEEGSILDLLDDFSAYDSKIFPALEDSVTLYKWGIYIRPPLKSMISKNITLLGDAAHPMVPFLGQGACMAIEDSYSFAMACKEHIVNLADAQVAYDHVRKRTKNSATLNDAGQSLSSKKSNISCNEECDNEVYKYSRK